MEQIVGWRRVALARAVDALEDPRAVFSLLLDNLPFAMFITLPAYAALLMLFFAGSRRFFTEHLVFAVQLHTFAFIVFAGAGAAARRRGATQTAVAARCGSVG